MCRNVGSFGQKSEIKERFFFAIIKALLWTGFCCRATFHDFLHCLYFFGHLFPVNSQLSKFYFWRGKFLKNDWELNQTKMIHWDFFLVGAIDSSKLWRRWNTRWPVAGIKKMLLRIMRRWESVSSFFSGSKNCHCPIFQSCQNLKLKFSFKKHTFERFKE